MSIRSKKYAIGMVFGVFDGLHPGHQFFLGEATKRCGRLIVVVALPEMVLRLKQHPPRHSYDDRVAAIRSFCRQCEIVPSDVVPKRWSAIETYHPDIVLLGHDQIALALALEKTNVPRMFLKPYRPDKYKSSLLRK